MTAQTTATQGERYILCKGAGKDGHTDARSAQKRERLTWDPGGMVAKAILSDMWETKISVIAGLVATLFPEISSGAFRLQNVVREALLEAADGNYDEAQAIEWAGGFEVPAGVHYRDSNLLDQAEGDLVEMTRRSHQGMSSDRLSAERVRRWISPSDQDFSRLLELCEGVTLLVPPGFVPNGSPPPLRNKYVRVHTAVNKMFYEAYQDGLVYLLPTTRLLMMRGVHWSAAHWTTKVGKKKGRNIGDLSNDERGGALNSPEVKALGVAAWGEICHPTVDLLVAMVLRQVGRSICGWKGIVLWKMDLKGAFTLMFMRPESVPLLAMELTGGVSMVYHTGLFGSTLMPGAFDVITRTLRRRLNAELRGEVEMYVDDIMGACLIEELVDDLACCTRVVEGLLGPNSVAHEKTCSSQTTGKIDWLGWEFNASSGLIGIAHKNFLRAFYGFFEVNHEGSIRARTFLRLASWASRYSLVCRPLRPLTTALFAEVRGLRNLEVSKRPSQEAVRSIQMWRVFLVAMELEGEGYRRRLESFILKQHSLVVEYDASLTGFGFRILRVEEGEERLWKIASIDARCELGGNSAFQNAMEYTAVVLAIGCMVKNGVREETVCIKGDNVSSLKWAEKERFKGNLCTSAAMCMMALLTVGSIDIVSTVHVSGDTNILCDQLSRGVKPSELGYQQMDIVESDDPFISALQDLCDPSIDHADLSKFCAFFLSVQYLVQTLED